MSETGTVEEKVEKKKKLLLLAANLAKSVKLHLAAVTATTISGTNAINAIKAAEIIEVAAQTVVTNNLCPMICLQ